MYEYEPDTPPVQPTCGTCQAWEETVQAWEETVRRDRLCLKARKELNLAYRERLEACCEFVVQAERYLFDGDADPDKLAALKRQLTSLQLKTMKVLM